MKNFPSHDQSQGPHPQKHELLMTKGRSGTPKETRVPMEPKGSFTGLGVDDETGKSVLTAQVESSVPACISGQDQEAAPRRQHTSSSPLVTGKDDKKIRYSVGTCAQQATKGRTAAGQEAASAQAVERGHLVTMIEVPDKEDNTTYQRWITKGSPMVTLIRPVAALPTPPDSPIQIGRTYTNGQTYQDWQNQGQVTSPTVVAPAAASAKV